MILFAVLLCHRTSAEPDRKFIRLRNELISTTRPAAGKAFPAQRAPQSGLFLVQFQEGFDARWRRELRDLGVDLIRFVPEDAFVARFDQARVAEVAALAYVRWVGPYRPGHKVHDGLQAYLEERAPGEPAEVLVLQIPEGRDPEPRRGEFQGLTRESRSSLGTVWRGWVSASQLARLAESPAVLWIEPARRMKLADEISAKIIAGGELPGSPAENGDLAGAKAPGRGSPAAKNLLGSEHATATQRLGFDGRGVVVALIDSGLHNGDADTMHPDLNGRVDTFLHYGGLLNAADEHGHGTHIAGIIAGDGATGEVDGMGTLYGLGVAPGAHLVVQRVFDAQGQDTLPSLETLTRDAVRAGAVIGSNSWGDDVQGRYDLNAAQFDALVRDADSEMPGDQPIILAFSAGNAGPGSQTVNSPAVGKNVIAAGASQNNRRGFFLYGDGPDATADFSSRGPCEDGRLKPDVVAPGTWVASLQSWSASEVNAWLPISGNYQYQGGTSQASPHVSGAAAVFVQFYREAHGNATPSPALVKAALINSAVDMDDAAGTGPIPNFDEGWGRVALTNVVGSTRRLEYVDQTVLLRTEQMYEHRVFVASGREGLKITLAYTDVPGLPAALPALVNDLDLEVLGPDGKVYRGNQFIDGESAAGASASDNINNVEAVHLRAPVAGDYLVRIRARNVAQDIRQREHDAPEQDFALVIAGDLLQSGVGMVALDQPVYRAPGVIGLKVIDTDLSNQAGVEVLLKSSSEVVGELIALSTSGVPGVFTGAVPLVTGPAAADGRLQISQGDTVEVSYDDASPRAVRSAVARTDLVPPRIFDLTLTNRFGREVISWRTDEATAAAVFYGTNAAQVIEFESPAPGTRHELELPELVPGPVYRFYVVAVDAAGNAATNDNGGNWFNFEAKPAPTVLLVDAYVPLPGFDVTEIPLSTYTDPLDQIGISYRVWDLSDPDAPSPSSEDLRPFRVVIWRLSDNLLLNATLSAAQQSVLQAYLHGGGSLFIASMELLSRLEPGSSFPTQVLQVRAFQENAGVPQVHGQPDDPVSSGMRLTLDYSAYNHAILEEQGLSPDASDTLTLTTNAVPIFFDTLSNRIVGLRSPGRGQDNAGRVVFLAFPFDAVPATGNAPNTRAALLRNVLGFLAPGLGGWGTISLDRDAYTLPDLVTIEVADLDLAGQGSTVVSCFSSTMLDGLPVTLVETARKGLFRGSLTLGAAAPAGQLGELRAKPNDEVWAEYLDATGSDILTAHALVDDDVPRIFGLATRAEYEEAVVSWSTSEPADALVQFGESTFLGRTAYSGQLDATHQLTLVGLRPDRTYYYRVVSRDRAGNPAVDNNAGKLHTFRTLKPLAVPWQDTLDGPDAAAHWSVENGAETLTSWQLGVPRSVTLQAHTPPHTWGTNLEGQAIDTADTRLITPAIRLAGGALAQMRFWQYYDFSGTSDLEWECGRLFISTNKNAPWTLLKEYNDASPGWIEETVDLSSYVGHVVRLAWDYQLFTWEATPGMGWLLDDISVMVTNPPVGAIHVTNNLAQASYSLEGPMSRKGQGWSTLFTNAFAGQYVIRFADVPFYITPPPQTNTVGQGETRVFRGDYVFLDANANRISDSWEQHYFGAIAPLHPGTTDSDEDGFNDLGEFLAGTHPVDAQSALHLALPVRLSNGTCQLSWPSVAGHNYRLLTSPDTVTWTPWSPWLRATGYQLSYGLKLDGFAPSMFYRLETSP